MNKHITAIVLAAGQGRRMGSKIQKQFLEMDGYPVLYYALKVLEEWKPLKDVILVAGEAEIPYCQQEIVEKYHFHKVKKVVAGGKERYDSVYEGLKACVGSDYVYIHDGARPFLDAGILNRIRETMEVYDACAVGVPSKDTIKIAGDDGCIAFTPSRDRVWNIQTPQAFAYSLIWEAHSSIRKKSMTGITDDAMIVEQETGSKVRLVEGSYENIKITTPEDLDLAKAILNKRKMA